MAACAATRSTVAAGAAAGRRGRARSGTPEAIVHSVSGQGEPSTSSFSQTSSTATTMAATTSRSTAQRPSGSRILMTGRYLAGPAAPSAARPVRVILGDDGAPPPGGERGRQDHPRGPPQDPDGGRWRREGPAVASRRRHTRLEEESPVTTAALSIAPPGPAEEAPPRQAVVGRDLVRRYGDGEAAVDALAGVSL